MQTKNDILSIIKQSSMGLKVSELEQKLENIPRRTLQRHLQYLVKSGAIMAQGQGPSRIYKSITDTTNNEDSFPDYIPLAADTLEVLNYINQPLGRRKSVGYQVEFLEAYVPNQSYYLSASLRTQLKHMGEMGKAALPAGTYGPDLVNRLLIDLSWASSHLEGNTYSLLDTHQLIAEGQVVEGKAVTETQMILNHKQAIEMLLENVANIDFNRYTLMNLHSTLAENLLANPTDEGRLRQSPVGIGRSVFQPLAIPQKIDQMLSLILAKCSEIRDPFEQCFFIMVHIPYLQPFVDVNKRTSRLAANIPLLKHNLCPLTFIDVPEPAYSRAILSVYELTRIELLRDVFVWAYERSSQAYVNLKASVIEPEPLRLQYRAIIKEAIKQIVQQPEQDVLSFIEHFVSQSIEASEQEKVRALILEELKRLHEGVLARYRLTLTEFHRWRAAQQRKY